MSNTPQAPQLQRALGLRDVMLFMITAGASPQWAATAAAAGPSSLVVWILGALGMFLPVSVCVVFLSSRCSLRRSSSRVQRRCPVKRAYRVGASR